MRRQIIIKLKERGLVDKKEASRYHKTNKRLLLT